MTLGLKKTEHTYHMKGKRLYRLKQHLWKDDEWVEDGLLAYPSCREWMMAIRCIIRDIPTHGCIGF